MEGGDYLGVKDWFKRKKQDPNDEKIPTGRASQIKSKYGQISPFRSRIKNILEILRKIPDEIDAIEFARKVTPDVSMAVWNFLRLANQGHQMEFHDLSGKRLPDIEKMWTEFAARVNEVSNSGMDGLIDILHYKAFVKGGQGIEAEVTPDRKDIYDVYPIDPQTLYWEVEERAGRKKWIPYQQQAMKKVSLEPGQANFFWVPTDSTGEEPTGTLHLVPVLQALDFQMQIFQDLAAVLHHQGWPRNDIKILLDRVMQAMPGDVKGSAVKQQSWLKEKWDEIVNSFNNLQPDSDYIHYDDIEISLSQGANSGRSLDVRAVSELVDQQVMTGAKQLSVFMNRNTGVTETFGTVQFKIAVGGIASIQRGSKRLIEEVARLWLRVKGIQGNPHFTHNKLDWQSEEQRMKVKLLEEEFWAVARLMNWCDNDKAAQEVIGAEKATSQEVSENVRASFERGDGEEKKSKPPN